MEAIHHNFGCHVLFLAAKKKILCMVWIIFIIFTNFLNQVHAQSMETVLSEEDGLKLIFRLVRDQNISDAQLSFEVENTTGRSAFYDDNGSGSRFAFRLFDSTGQALKPVEDWARTIDPHTSENRKHDRGEILPGGRLTYSLPFKDAFGEAWASGVRLEVEWNPGYHSRGAYDLGWGLRGWIDTTEIVKPAPSSFGRDEVKDTAPDNDVSKRNGNSVSIQLPISPTTSMEDSQASAVVKSKENSFNPSQSVWSWIFGLLLVILSALFWRRMKAIGSQD